MAAETEHRDGIAIIRFSNPPVNALSVGGGLVGDLAKAVGAALDNPAITSLVIHGERGIFSAGADINDFGGDPAELDALRGLFDRIELSPKPIVMAISGIAFGGGLELAMAGHYRVAVPGARFGLPEVTLGILPGAGGTQRLPRLVGPALALEMMTSGKPINAPAALNAKLIDRIDDDPIAAAVDIIADGAQPRPARALPIAADTADHVAAARAAKRPKSFSKAPEHIIRCVEAGATGGFDAGIETETTLFTELMASEPSLGLRHAFLGQRKAAVIPGLPAGTKADAIASAAVVGGGLMGTGIALSLLNAGLSVVVIEPRDEARAAAAARIRDTIERDVKKGRIAQAVAEKRLAALEMDGDLKGAAGADIVIEAVFEDMAVKHQVFGELDRITKPEAILASNTSTLDLNEIARSTNRPDRVVGLHFFSPANIMRLVEVVRGAETAPRVLATAMAFVKKIGKVGVVAGVCDGFIGNRIFEEYLRQAYFLIEEGALPQQVDKALEAWGMAMGPFRTMDLAGQDIGWSIRKRRKIEQPDRPYSAIPDRICEMGRYGQKTGSGFYTYADGRTAEVDPSIDALVIAYSAEIGVERREIDDQEIVSRCILAMVNEGARIVAEGIAYRPVDVDIIYLNGYGFPAERGGPMFYADRVGLPEVLAKIQGYAAGNNGWSWEPAQLLVDLVARGGTFEELNG